MSVRYVKPEPSPSMGKDEKKKLLVQLVLGFESTLTPVESDNIKRLKLQMKKNDRKTAKEQRI